MDAFIQKLKSEKILVYKPGETEYERSVATANLLYRFARPGCVVQPERNSHVQTIVREAKSRKISITIKNGGHSYAGFSIADDGISLDLTKMRRVDLNVPSMTVTMQGGAQWGNAYRKLVDGRFDGYIINGGRCPTVGVSGFTLGGGLSPFTRSFGMGCDTMTEATIVTADGNEVTVKKTDDPKSDKGKLFWALCGAGGGNFGVVVQLKLSVQKLQNPNGNVVAGVYTWDPTALSTNDLLATMNRFYTTNWPNQLTIDTSWVCDLQGSPGRDLAVRFIVYFDGNKNEFDGLIDKNITQGDLAKQLKRRSMEEKSTRFLHETLVAQWSDETVRAFPSNPSNSLYSSFVFKNDKDRIENVTSIIQREMAAFKRLFTGEQCLLQVTWIHGGGEASKKKRSASAFRWRDGVYHAYIWIRWQEKFLERDMRGFVQAFKDKLRPFSMMGRASFINFPDGTLTVNTHERVYYGNNRQELQRIKKIWDKDNFFQWSQGVRLPQPKNTSSQSSAPVTSRMMMMEVPQAVAFRIAASDGQDFEGASEQLAADEQPDDDGGRRDEQALTDNMARDQWERFTMPAENNFVGGLQGLNSLGF